MQSPDIQMGLNTHQATGAPEGQGLGGRPLLSLRGTHLGKKQCQRGGGERPVMGQRRRDVGGGLGRGLGTGGSSPPTTTCCHWPSEAKSSWEEWAGGSGGQTLSSRERWQ